MVRAYDIVQALTAFDKAMDDQEKTLANRITAMQKALEAFVDLMPVRAYLVTDDTLEGEPRPFLVRATTIHHYPPGLWNKTPLRAPSEE
jgi:hypothetical protein